MWKRLVVPALILISCASSNSVSSTPTTAGQSILFIGNSLTYYNDLPRTLADLAATRGDTLRVEAIVGPDLALDRSR